MNYSKERISAIVEESVSSLREEQPMLFQKDNNIAERVVSSALLIFFAPHFPDYAVNSEYNRMTDESGKQTIKRIHRDPCNEKLSKVFPDIIVHQQANKDNNLLAVEIKMEWKNAEKNDDYKKLVGYTKDLLYQYGLYLELGEQGIIEMTWFQNGEQI